MSTTIRVSSPAAFLALVPRLVGCSPIDSLVVVPFSASLSLGAMRIDLPRPQSEEERDRIASTLIGMTCKVTDADGLAVVAYTGDAAGGPDGLPHRAVIESLLARADICGLRVVDALVVAADGWASYLEQMPASVHPLDDLPAPSAEVADLPLETDQFAPALPDVSPHASRRLERLLVAAERVLGASSTARPSRPTRAVEATVAALADPPSLFESALDVDPEDLDPAVLASIALALARPLLRDVALMQWAADITVGDATFLAQTQYAHGHPFPEHLARPMWGEGPRPDATRLARALALCRLVAAAIPTDRRAGPLSACAWLSWAAGRGTHAADYAEQALCIEPSHGMSGIVRALACEGRLPEWAFERPAEVDVTSRGERGSSRGSRAR